MSKKKDLSIGYLDQYAAIQSSRTVWEEMVHLFEDVETLKKQAQKAAEQLGDPDLLSDPVAYELALRRYDQLQEELNQRMRMVTSLKFVPFFMDSVSIQKTTTNRFKHSLEANALVSLLLVFY